MDQEKVGKFIAECRKEKGLTQAQLAEKFGISNRAVSKWETGKSLPDASIMIDLSNYLGITVNELLTGERFDMEEYKEKAEQTIVEVQKEKEQTKKNYKKAIIIILIFVLILTYLALKFFVINSVKSSLGNLANASVDMQEIEFSFNLEPSENFISDNGLQFDNRYDFEKVTDESIKVYLSQDKKVRLAIHKPQTYISIEDDSWQATINSDNFIKKLLLGKNSFKKYVTENKISSYPELLIATYLDDKPIKNTAVFSPLSKFRGNLVRGELKNNLIVLTDEYIYYADTPDYIIFISVSDNKTRYSFTAYSRNDNSEIFVDLEDIYGTLTQEEIIDFFESISIEK